MGKSAQSFYRAARVMALGGSEPISSHWRIHSLGHHTPRHLRKQAQFAPPVVHAGQAHRELMVCAAGAMAITAMLGTSLPASVFYCWGRRAGWPSWEAAKGFTPPLHETSTSHCPPICGRFVWQ